LGLAVLPWIVSLLESAKLPGGWEFKFHQVEAKVEATSQKADETSTCGLNKSEG
jgi:hypothetical protein